MVSALDSGLRGLGSSPSRGDCVVFLGKTLCCHSAFFNPRVNGYQQTVREPDEMLGGLPAMD